MKNAAPPQTGVIGSHDLRRLIAGSHDQLTTLSVSLPMSVRSLAAAAEALEVGSVFIIPDGHASVAAESPSFWAVTEAGWEVRGLHSARGIPTSVQVRRPGGRLIVVTNLARDTRWEMFRPLRGTQVDATLLYLRETLGREVAYSPGHTGRELFEAVVPRSAWLRPLTKRMPAIKTVDMAWVRTFGPEAGALWAGDVNAAYLAVAADQDFGAGDPQSVTDVAPGHIKHYGFYHISASADESPWTGGALPNPFGGTSRTVDGWWAAPHVRAAIELGWQVRIVRGLVWPDGYRHRMMLPWAKRLWEARQALATDAHRFPDRDAARAAILFLKLTYAQTIALFAREPAAADPGEPAFAALGRRRFVRPDWRAWILAECYRRRLWEIRKLHAAGRAPIAAHVDTLVLAGQRDPAAPEELLRWGGLGGYKISAVVDDPAGVARLASLAAGPVSALGFVEAVKREAAHGPV